MDRRLLLGAAAAVAPVALMAPALAQTAMPEVRWRVQSSFPRVFDVLYGTLERVAARVAQLTDNKFRIQVFHSGVLVPESATLDAVQAGPVDCTHTASHYFAAKEPISAFAGTIETIVKYDAQNPLALRRLVADGTQLRRFPRPVMEACYRSAIELHDQTAARNLVFKTVYDHFGAYRDTQLHWFRVAEGTDDNFVYRIHAAETAEASRR